MIFISRPVVRLEMLVETKRACFRMVSYAFVSTLSSLGRSGGLRRSHRLPPRHFSTKEEFYDRSFTAQYVSFFFCAHAMRSNVCVGVQVLFPCTRRTAVHLRLVRSPASSVTQVFRLPFSPIQPSVLLLRRLLPRRTRPSRGASLRHVFVFVSKRNVTKRRSVKNPPENILSMRLARSGCVSPTRGEESFFSGASGGVRSDGPRALRWRTCTMADRKKEKRDG